MPGQPRHTGAARHARAPRLWPRVVGITAGGLAVAMVATVGIAALKLQSNIQVSDLPPAAAPTDGSTPTPEEHDATNVLVIGSDSRAGDNADYGNEADAGRRSDSLLLVHIAEDNARMDVLQIPRDTLVDLPACEDTGEGPLTGGYGMINSALMAGEACSVKAVNAMTGVEIDHFVSLDFVGFKSVVDAIDGLPVCLPDAMTDPLAGLDLPEGEQTLDGEDALALARTRHAVGDGSDLARLGNQQMVMSALVQRATSIEVLTRPDRLYGFLDAVTSSLSVDRGLGSIPDLSSIALRVSRVAPADITFLAMPVDEAPSDPNRVVPSAAAETVFQNLRADAPISIAGDGDEDEATDEAEEERTRTAAVTVLNATMTPGLAGSTSEELAGFGYGIAGLGDAEAGGTRVLIADTEEARATAESLIAETGLNLEPEVDPTATGVTVVVGEDYDELREPVASEETVEATARAADESLCG